MSDGGSFRGALGLLGDPEIDYMKDVLFFGIYCETIVREFPLVQHRIVTQAVEHETHCVLVERTNRFRLISDTVRTAPRKFKHWQTARAIALICVDDFLSAIDGQTLTR